MSIATPTLVTLRANFRLRLRDYSELVKARVTTLIVMTAWCGFYLGARKSGVPSISWTMMHALAGIALVAGGTAALNEVMERDLDRLMRRTAIRPLVTGRMGLAHGLCIGVALVLGGSLYMWLTTSWLAAALTFATSVTYLAAYTPLKRVHPICTFVGAFPGAMPPLLGWAAVRRVEWEALLLFGIVFCWQFPHFHSIAWLYREDYERAGIRMLPVADGDGRSTAREIVLYLGALLLMTVAVYVLGIAGRAYLVAALVLGAAFFVVGWQLAMSKLTPQDARSKHLARRVLQASVIYLPLLFAMMMIDARL
ncbi:MAG: heme o synthase [Terriglobales bacterium]